MDRRFDHINRQHYCTPLVNSDGLHGIIAPRAMLRDFKISYIYVNSDVDSNSSKDNQTETDNIITLPW
jgi:hypothetical protein